MCQSYNDIRKIFITSGLYRGRVGVGRRASAQRRPRRMSRAHRTVGARIPRRRKAAGGACRVAVVDTPRHAAGCTCSRRGLAALAAQSAPTLR
ncbi:unnamed protein product, partial [Iphiclides podalirius]